MLIKVLIFEDNKTNIIKTQIRKVLLTLLQNSIYHSHKEN